MRALAILLVGILMLHCAAPREPDPPRETALQAMARESRERTDALERALKASLERSKPLMGPWVECLTKSAPRLDDGRSDASTIASATANRCQSLGLDWHRSAYPDDLIGFEQARKRPEQVRDLGIELALEVVLTLRSRADGQ